MRALSRDGIVQCAISNFCAMCNFPSPCALSSAERGPVFFCLPFSPVTAFVFLFWVYRVFSWNR